MFDIDVGMETRLAMPRIVQLLALKCLCHSELKLKLSYFKLTKVLFLLFFFADYHLRFIEFIYLSSVDLHDLHTVISI